MHVEYITAGDSEDDTEKEMSMAMASAICDPPKLFLLQNKPHKNDILYDIYV